MVPIANRPMMEHIVYLLKKHGFTEVISTLFYMPESIANYFGDGRNFGLKMSYMVEESPLGTAGSVKNAEEKLDETFLVISGDALTDIDLTAAVKFHRDKRATATLILTKVDTPLEYGVVITDAEGRIRRFLEKPGWGEVFSDTVNTGIYILDPKIFSYYQKGQEYDFSKNLFPQLLEKGEPLYGYVAPGYWSDIGNLEQYRQAHQDVLSGKVKVSIPGREIRPGVWVGEAVELDAAAKVEGPVLLGDYCRVKAEARIAEYSVIGDYGIIQEDTSIKRSILWNHCYVGQGCEVRGATIAQHTYLKGKNSVYEGAVIGEGVGLGYRSIIRPGVKIWPDKEVDSGATLNDSLIWAKKTAKSLFGTHGISGTINRELTPEFAAKLGAVFGAHAKPGSHVVVSSDDYRPARVLKRALVSGVLAAGVCVYDLGTMATPLTRYALVSLGAKAGVHLRINPNDAEELLVEFFDHQGLNIDKAAERSLENAFFSEDFPRAAAGVLGELTFVPQLAQPYLHGLTGSSETELIRSRQFKVAVAYDRGKVALILPSLLESLGCRIIQVDEPERQDASRPRTIKELLGVMTQVTEKIKETRADLGVIVDNNAERVILFDDQGEITKEEQFTGLLSYLVLKHLPSETVPAPVTAPQYLEDLAKEFRGKVIRTKANPRSLMEKVAQEKLFPTGEGNGTYHPHFDALFGMVKILELLAREGATLSQAKALLPHVARGYQEAECPWEDKGRIMRSLFEENKERQLETTDGLKIYHDQGWALVLPDADEPIFRIYAEANTNEEADALTSMYMSRISQLQTDGIGDGGLS